MKDFHSCQAVAGRNKKKLKLGMEVVLVEQVGRHELEMELA